MPLSVITLPVTLGVPVAGRSFILSPNSSDDLSQQLRGPTAVRMITNHDHTTPPYAKLCRVSNIQTEETGEATIVRYEIEMETADFSFIPPYHHFSFTHDHRPFLPLVRHDGFHIDIANFNTTSMKKFTTQVDEILPNIPIQRGENRSIDPIAVLGISGSIAAAAIGIRQLPVIGPMIREAEEGIVAGLDVKGRVSRAIQSFVNKSNATHHRVETHFHISEHLTLTFISDANDTPKALEIANQVVRDNVDFMEDATEVVYLYHDGSWHFQYKTLKNGDVLVSSECFNHWVNLLESINKSPHGRQQKQ